jgi:hypothetical protein
VIRKLVLISSLLFLSSNSFAKPDDHAPVGVMRDHIHKKGEFMTSYRYSLMQMKGLRNNTDRVSTAQALQNYMAAPKNMQMQMHMIGAMYGITNELTISAMGSLVEKKMDHAHRVNSDFKREASGYGDTKINFLYQFLNNNGHKAQLNFGVSLPTGKINEAFNSTRLPYSMQIGSGSYEALPGLLYKISADHYSFGTQANAVLRLDTNTKGYKLGDKYNVTSWVARNLNENISVSTRLDYQIFEAIEGLDQSISNTAMIASRDTSLYDGRRLDLSFGVNYLFNEGFLQDNRLAIELGTPIYQRLDGLQMEVDYKLTVGWQKIF